MWSYNHTQKVNGIDAKLLWSVWTDVNQWNLWQDDIDYARLSEPFEKGAIIDFRPKGGPNIKLELTEVEKFKSFTDLTRFLFAKMHDKHEIIETEEGLEIKISLTLVGPLSFLWKKIVVEEIAKGLSYQTDNLIRRTLEVQKGINIGKKNTNEISRS